MVYIGHESLLRALHRQEMIAIINRFHRMGVDEDTFADEFLVPFFKDLGYENIQRKVRVTTKLGSRVEHFEADATVAIKDRPVPVLVIEVKRPGEDLKSEYEQQAISYAVLLGAQYALLTNGREWDLIEPIRGVVSWKQRFTIGRELADFLSNMEKFVGPPIRWPVQFQYEAERLVRTFAHEREVWRVFDDIHEYIRSHEGMDPRQRLYELAKLLMIKLLDEKSFYELERELEFSHEKLNKLDPSGALRLAKAYFETVKRELSGIFDPPERVALRDGRTVIEVFTRLEPYSLYKTRRDILGIAYERFLRGTMTGRELGEFFTPREIVQFMVSLIKPKPNETVLDPACGTCGFLIEAYNFASQNYGDEAVDKFRRSLYGIDIEELIVKLGRVNMYFHAGNEWELIQRANSLDIDNLPEIYKMAWENPMRNGFDIILTNPPFGRGAKKNIRDKRILRHFESPCAREDDGTVREKGAEVPALFVEFFLKVLRPGGRIATIIDDGLLANIYLPFTQKPVYLKFRDWLLENSIVRGVISLPPKTFEPYGSGVKASILVLQKKSDEVKEQPNVFYAETRHVGYKLQRQQYEPIPENDLTRYLNDFENWLSKRDLKSAFYGGE